MGPMDLVDLDELVHSLTPDADGRQAKSTFVKLCLSFSEKMAHWLCPHQVDYILKMLRRNSSLKELYLQGLDFYSFFLPKFREALKMNHTLETEKIVGERA